MLKNKVVILLTDSYPFGYNEPFVENEIKHIADSFEKIILISFEKDPQQLLPIPKNIVPINSPVNLTTYDKIKSIKYLFTALFWDEIKTLRKTVDIKINFLIVKTILDILQSSEECMGIINKAIVDNNLLYKDIILYSYWNDYRALACGRLARKNNVAIVISRTHGWDTYFERHPYCYLPMKKKIIDLIDRLFTVSQHGKNYLQEKLNNIHKNKISISRLGVAETMSHTELEQLLYDKDEKRGFNLVSCSRLVEIKRVDLIIKSLACVEKIKINWIHIGGGILENDIMSLAKKLLDAKENISYRFLGNISNEEVINSYKKNKIHVLINLSEDEGIPVTMMEAMACGIPVIGTNVGGVSEIVKHKFNGILLASDPSPKEIASEIMKYDLMDNAEKNRYRENAYNTWKENYDAEKNYRLFCDELNNLLNK